MTTRQPLVSVIVLVWPPGQRRDRNAFTLLDSLPSGLTPEELQVVAVCNGDDPHLADRLDAHPAVDLVLRPGVNLGVASGWNTGSRAASGEILCFANEDVTLGSDTLRRMVDRVCEDGDALIGVEGSVWDTDRLRPIRGRQRAGQGAFVAAGYLFAVRRRVWIEVGGVDDRLSPAFFEEVDLALRVHRAGYRTEVISPNDVDHPWGVSAARRAVRVDWAGGTGSLAAIHRRNERLMLKAWSADRWRSRALVHPMLYTLRVGKWRLDRLRDGVGDRLAGRTGSGRSYAARMVRGVLAGASGMLWVRATGLLVLPLLVRALGLPLYGAWAIAGIVIGSQGLFDLGMTAATAKFVAEAQERQDRAEALRVIGLSLAGYTVLSAAFGAAMVPLLSHIPGWLHLPAALGGQAQLLFAGAIGLYALSNWTYVFAATLQGLQRLTVANTALVVAQVPYVVLVFLTWRYGWGVPGLLWALAALYGVQMALMAPAALAGLPVGPRTECQTPLRSFLSFGIKVQLSTGADFLVFQAPRILAGVLLGASAAGRLDLGMRLPVVASGAALPLLPPLVPAASRLSVRGAREPLRDLYKQATRYLAIVCLPIFLVVLVYGPSLLVRWVGPSARDLGWVVRLFAVGLLAHTLAGVATSLAIGTGRPNLVARYKGLVLVVTLVSLLAVRGSLGIIGIAAGVTAGCTAGCLYFIALVDQAVAGRGVALSARALARPTAAAALSVALAAFAFAGLQAAGIVSRAFWAGSIGVGGYPLFLIATRAITREDATVLLGDTGTRTWERVATRARRQTTPPISDQPEYESVVPVFARGDDGDL